MNMGFTQTAVLDINRPTGFDIPACLPGAIRKHTDWNYTCTQTDAGCFLKPSFRAMPYRNSFVPEIWVGISESDGRISLHIKGQPVKTVRISTWIWCGLLLAMEAVFLAMAAAVGIDAPFPLLAPVCMCAFGYFLCKTGTALSFRCVVKAIRKEFAQL